MGGSAGPRLAAKTIEHQFLYALEQDFLVAFSCRSRGLCPSCATGPRR